VEGVVAGWGIVGAGVEEDGLAGVGRGWREWGFGKGGVGGWGFRESGMRAQSEKGSEEEGAQTRRK
jgi:hypothetical protein